MTPANNPTSDPRPEIEKANAALCAAYKVGDAAAIAAMYTPTARLLPPHAAIVEGGGAIEQFWTAVMGSGIAALQLTTSEVEAFGETAVESGSATLFGSDNSILDRGKYLVVWNRVQGQWKLHRDCWNSNEPIPSK